MIRDAARALPFAKGAAAALRKVKRAIPRGPRPVILMYHRIAHDRFDPWGLAVSPDNFADQLQWLAANRMVLPLAEFAERHRQGTLPRNAAAITFDDGYRSNVTAAAPLLEKHGLPATIFLPVELIEQGRPFWWDELQGMVLVSTRKSLRLGDQEIDLGEKSASDGEWRPFEAPQTARQRAFHRIWAMLRHKPPAELETAMGELEAQAGGAPWQGPDPPMTPDDVRAIASERLEFGSHALTHPSLPALGPAEKATEIKASFERTRALTGTVPLSFAYPYGDRDDESEELVRQAGFRCACATDDRPVDRRSRLFALPRISIANCKGAELGKALAGF